MGKPSRAKLSDFIEENIKDSCYRYASDMDKDTYQDLLWVVREIKKAKQRRL